MPESFHEGQGARVHRLNLWRFSFVEPLHVPTPSVDVANQFLTEHRIGLFGSLWARCRTSPGRFLPVY